MRTDQFANGSFQQVTKVITIVGFVGDEALWPDADSSFHITNTLSPQ